MAEEYIRNIEIQKEIVAKRNRRIEKFVKNNTEFETVSFR